MGRRRTNGGALFCAVAVAAASVPSRAEEARAHSFLSKTVGFTDAQIASVDAGEVVVKSLPAADKPEIAAFGAVRIRGVAAACLDRLRDGVAARRCASVLEIGRFSRPPKVADLDGLTLDEGDFKGAQKCRPGDCEVKLARSAIERMHREIDWKAADARARTFEVLKAMLVDYVAAYMEGGTAAMATYVDKDKPQETPAEFAKLLAASPYLVQYVPAFHQYVEDYPKGTLAGAEDAFYWVKDKFGPKPTLSVYHTTIWPDPAEAGRAIVASKQIYASHYFQAGLDVLALVPAGADAFYLFDVYRVRIDPPTGMLSGVILGKIRGGVEQGVSEGLKTARARAEAR
jgi:hypothetical protein